jgi:arylformamidase
MSFDDRSWCEAEYNPRLIVADAADYAPKWVEWAKASRDQYPFDADLRYGPHPRETIDIFHAEEPKATLVFIHGGYWRVHSKDVFSWVVDALIAKAVSVAVINYPLCPEVRIGDIVGSCRKAIADLWHHHLSATEKANMVVSGHSAGGYLTAAMFATDWRDHGLPATPFVGGVPISGVFDVRPLIMTTINEQAQITAESATALNLLAQQPLVDAPLVPIYGALESSEFRRQSEAIAKVWPRTETAIGVSDRHHFNIVESIKEPSTPVYDAILRLAGL